MERQHQHLRLEVGTATVIAEAVILHKGYKISGIQVGTPALEILQLTFRWDS